MSHVDSPADKAAVSQQILEQLFVLVQERVLQKVDLSFDRPSPEAVEQLEQLQTFMGSQAQPIDAPVEPEALDKVLGNAKRIAVHPIVEGAVVRLVLALVKILKPEDKSCTVRPSDLIVGMDLHKIGRQLGINGMQMQGVMRVTEEVFLTSPVFAKPINFYQDGKSFLFTRHSESETFTVSRP